MAAAELKLDIFGLISMFIVIMATALFKFILKLGDDAEKPTVYQNENGKVSKVVLDRCKKLNETYTPTYLWGKNGHLQSAIHSVFGRSGRQMYPKSKMHSLFAADGATITYNFFSQDLHNGGINPKKKNIILIVPGIANCSKDVYVNAITLLLLGNGYDVVVFNHLGAHPVVKLTSPRLFTYGCTDDLNLVVKDVLEKHPGRKFIGLGFSMGGNILLKYLGEHPARQKFFLFAVSVCQGYDVTRGCHMLLQWKGFRRFYNWLISKKVKKLITKKHRQSFLDFERKGSFERIDWRRISSASSLQELDDTVMRRFASFDDVRDFYRWCSSANYMHKITIPALLLNSLDDPLIPESLYDCPKKLVDLNSEVIFVVTKHGGHLGFFEGGFLCPNETTWLDQALLEYILAMEDELDALQIDNEKDSWPAERVCFSI